MEIKNVKLIRNNGILNTNIALQVEKIELCKRMWNSRNVSAVYLENINSNNVFTLCNMKYFPLNQ